MNKFSLILLLWLPIFPSLWAQSIFNNPITGTNPNTSNPYTTGQVIDANISVSGIGRGSGIAGSNANNRYNATGWNSTSLDLNDYFYFTLTPNSSYKINFSSLDYAAQASGTGPTSFSFRSSLDNYASDISIPSFANDGNPHSGSIDLSGANFQNITSTITFRFYGWNASAGGGTCSINDFQFNGNVVCSTPSVQASGISIVAGNTSNSLAVSFTRGNGNNVIVLAKDGSSVDSDPVNGVSYTANSVFSLGDQIGTGNFVVYKGTGSNVTVTGLTSGHTYYFAIYEFFACSPNYLTPGATSNALPITLTSFNAINFNENILLSFSTATERENDYFSIERSNNGRDYTEIGQVKGAGTSYLPQDYTFTDEQPLRGKNYYRLRQVDFDGKYTYSPVVTATFGKTSQMTLAPLPATETLIIQLEKPTQNDGLWQIFDMNGRQLLSGEILAETIEQSIQIGELPEGAYVLRLTVGQEVMVEQFRKQR